jgi:hypothetical protein
MDNNGNSDNYKKCKICKKNISITSYRIHKNKCESQMIMNPNNHMLTSHIQLIYQMLDKYNELFKNFVNNKTIALVGPAESILNTGKGNLIDKFDIVVRLNKSLPIPKNMENDIGTKTDILYNSLNITDFPGQNKFGNTILKNNNISFLCSSYPIENEFFKNDILNYIQRSKFGVPFKVLNNKIYNSIEKSIGTRPYTGTSAIMDLLNCNIKYLYITGLDFYTTKYYNEYRKINKEQLKKNRSNFYHKSEPQLKLLEHLSLYDDRIILDNYLDKLLYNKYYDVTKILNKYKHDIFSFENQQLKDFFHLNICNITYSILSNDRPNNDKPTVIFTNNKFISKEKNVYLIYITPNMDELNKLNKNLEEKIYIGNFFYKKQHMNQKILIYLNINYLNFIKKTLMKINIKNCNVHFLMFISLIIYSKENHYFNSNEILKNWGLNNEEKKYFLFLKKKNSFNDLA